ncbi:hypothetical protein EI42_03101 [Thermosporothrix hazakensis]|uniref:Uncharacterized protein n=1 Tax=Thermosporothrix hazakensis TaxID=644383 RepID=A0A326U718_THEHA|nr:hypothetical protein [Thermosporothrix hazakensis]PZW28347.1 hypothetical protein EI42_03101 [Thermosporothrix hazakensis]GCE46294.1 hypothetical protein KTH_11630 [Thermosporothrix hazakensis]
MAHPSSVSQAQLVPQDVSQSQNARSSRPQDVSQPQDAHSSRPQEQAISQPQNAKNAQSEQGVSRPQSVKNAQSEQNVSRPQSVQNAQSEQNVPQQPRFQKKKRIQNAPEAALVPVAGHHIIVEMKAPAPAPQGITPESVAATMHFWEAEYQQAMAQYKAARAKLQHALEQAEYHHMRMIQQQEQHIAFLQQSLQQQQYMDEYAFHQEAERLRWFGLFNYAVGVRSFIMRHSPAPQSPATQQLHMSLRHAIQLLEHLQQARWDQSPIVQAVREEVRLAEQQVSFCKRKWLEARATLRGLIH